MENNTQSNFVSESSLTEELKSFVQAEILSLTPNLDNFIQMSPESVKSLFEKDCMSIIEKSYVDYLLQCYEILHTNIPSLTETLSIKEIIEEMKAILPDFLTSFTCTMQSLTQKLEKDPIEGLLDSGKIKLNFYDEDFYLMTNLSKDSYKPFEISKSRLYDLYLKEVEVKTKNQNKNFFSSDGLFSYQSIHPYSIKKIFQDANVVNYEIGLFDQRNYHYRLIEDFKNIDFSQEECTKTKVITLGAEKKIESDDLEVMVLKLADMKLEKLFLTFRNGTNLSLSAITKIFENGKLSFKNLELTISDAENISQEDLCAFFRFFFDKGINVGIEIFSVCKIEEFDFEMFEDIIKKKFYIKKGHRLILRSDLQKILLMKYPERDSQVVDKEKESMQTKFKEYGKAFVEELDGKRRKIDLHLDLPILRDVNSMKVVFFSLTIDQNLLSNMFQTQELQLMDTNYSYTFMNRYLKITTECSKISDVGIKEWSQSPYKLFSMTTHKRYFLIISNSIYIRMNYLRKSLVNIPSSLKDFTISFYKCKQMNDYDMKELSQFLNKIASPLTNLSLNFEKCNAISDYRMKELSQSINKLSSLTNLYLNFRECGKMSDDTIKELSQSLKKLSSSITILSLNFSSCKKMSDNGMHSLYQSLYHLSSLTNLYLNFGFCDGVSQDAMKKLCQYPSRLSFLTNLSLYIHGCNMNDDVMKELCQSLMKCSSLTDLNLDLNWCDKISDDGVRELRESLSKVSSLTYLKLQLSSCPQLNHEELKNFEKMAKDPTKKLIYVLVSINYRAMGYYRS